MPQWSYAVQFDSPQGFVEEYHAEDLVLESDIPQLQAGWDVASEPEAAVEKCDPACAGRASLRSRGNRH